MKARVSMAALFACAIVCVLALNGCKKSAAPSQPSVAYGAYDTEPDWDDNTKLIKLGYQEADGKRIFYQYCRWCHAAAGPLGPSNRSNLTPLPPLMNDGGRLNGKSDEYMRDIIALGGNSVGKSPMMPPYGKVLSTGEITNVIAFARSIAHPGYRKPGRPGLQTSITEKVLALGSLVEGEGFSVTVNGSVQRQGEETPTGTVTFFIGATQFGSPVRVAAVPRRNGAAPDFWATSSMTIPEAGSHTLIAEYSGDSNYAPSTTSMTINVLHHATSSISFSPATVNYGDAVTIRGVIDTAIPNSNTALKPMGTVALSGTADGQVKSGVNSVTTAGANGNWEIQLSATIKPANSETFQVTYGGDSNYGVSVAYSSEVAVKLPDFSLTANPGSVIITPTQNGSSTINIAPLTNMGSTVALTCSDPLLVNVACTVSPDSIRLANHASGTAIVTLAPREIPSSGTAGTQAKLDRVRIWNGRPAVSRPGWRGISVCAAVLALLWLVFARKRSYRFALGIAGACIAALAFGCAGDGDGANAVPAKIAIATSATKTPAANTPSLTLTATVTSPKPVTGTVNFWENGSDKALGLPTKLVNGTATAQVALSSPGVHQIYAEYTGDANNQPSRSSAIAIVATGSARAQIQGATGPVIHETSVDVTIQ